MADVDADFDDQDQSEVFDEENTNDADRGPGEEAEQFEDLVDVYDATSAVGDDDDDDGLIGEDMDDDEIIAAAQDDLEDDLDTFQDDEDADDAETSSAGREVELQFVGDLSDAANAASSASDMESDSLSDADLRELDYKDAFTRDDGVADSAPPSTAPFPIS